MTSLGMRSARISRSSPELIARKYGMPYGKQGVRNVHTVFVRLQAPLSCIFKGKLIRSADTHNVAVAIFENAINAEVPDVTYDRTV